MKKIVSIGIALALISASFCSCSSKNKTEALTTTTEPEYISQDYYVVTDYSQTEVQTQPQIPEEAQTQTQTQQPQAQQTQPQPQTYEPVPDEDNVSKGSFSGSDAAVSINGTTVKAGDKYSDCAQSLGTASSVTQAPSCHYSGMDNIYTFSGYTVYTYFSGSSEIIYDVEVSSSSVSTAKGVRVGDSAATVKEYYGNPKAENDSCIEYSQGSTHLSFYMIGGTVDTIEISVD